MNQSELFKLMEEHHSKRLSLMSNKSVEYSRDGDRLHNFKKAAKLAGTTPEFALAMFMAKHVISIYDMINDLEENPDDYQVDLSVWNEKLYDLSNYTDLLRALLIERAGREIEFIITEVEKRPGYP